MSKERQQEISERVSIIKSRLLTILSANEFTITDESDQHAGHSGFDEKGSHFAIHISSKRFQDMSRIHAHRQIYALFSDMMPHDIHALRIIIKSLQFPPT